MSTLYQPGAQCIRTGEAKWDQTAFVSASTARDAALTSAEYRGAEWDPIVAEIDSNTAYIVIDSIGSSRPVRIFRGRSDHDSHA